MRVEPVSLTRTGVVGVLGIALILGLTVSPARAESEYEIDIKGTLEVISAATTVNADAGEEIQYYVSFNYQAPGIEGSSSLDRSAPVVDGKFEIPRLSGNIVYQVTVQRVSWPNDGTGLPRTEDIVLDIPEGFFRMQDVSSASPQVVELELPLSRSIAVAGRPSLGFMCTGPQIILSELAPVS